MRQYKDLVERILSEGAWKDGRNGRTLSVFNHNYQVDLQTEGFPVLTSKKVNWRAAIYELIWYLSGSRNIAHLNQYTRVWEPWADELGYVSSAYGQRWRAFDDAYHSGNSKFVSGRVDQLQFAIDLLKTDPMTRRAVVVAWDPRYDAASTLPPCHFAFVFNVNGGRLHLHLTQRSCDVAIGLPFNMIAYSALLIMVAQLVGLEPGIFGHSIVDAHIYEQHIEQLTQQVRDRPTRDLPRMVIARKASIDDYTYEGVVEDFVLEGYDPYPAIKYEVIV